MKYCLAVFLMMTLCQSRSQCESFIPIDTVYIGDGEKYQSPADYFKDPRSNVMVYLKEGIYYTGEWLMIDGDHIILEGLGDAHIYCTELHENVMWVSANHVWIKHLTMKHFEPGSIYGQNCSGRVLGFDNASNITVEDCDLNGCGLAGLHDNLGNSKIFIKDNHIHNNSVGAYTDIEGNVWQEEIDDHPVFSFENNLIENNGPQRLYEFDTLNTEMMDETQLEIYMRTISEWLHNSFGTCGRIMEMEIESQDFRFEDMEFVIQVNDLGEVTFLYFTEAAFASPKNEVMEELANCIKESVEVDWYFSEPLFGRFIRYRYTDY